MTPEARDFWLYRPPVLIALVLLLVVIASVYFFRGSTWAGTVAARAGVQPVSERDLRERLVAVNRLDAPFSVTDAGDGRMAVTWRFADAKWVDLARAHSMRRTHRIVLDFDDRTKTVYATDQQSSLDWSAGASGARYRRGDRGGLALASNALARATLAGLAGRLTRALASLPNADRRGSTPPTPRALASSRQPSYLRSHDGEGLRNELG